MSFATGLHRGIPVPSVGTALSQHFPFFLAFWWSFPSLKGKLPRPEFQQILPMKSNNLLGSQMISPNNNEF